MQANFPYNWGWGLKILCYALSLISSKKPTQGIISSDQKEFKDQFSTQNRLTEKYEIHKRKKNKPPKLKKTY